MIKLNKIYTRTGDDGTTGLVDGSRNPKHAPRMQAIGDVDEANSSIGVALAALGTGEWASALLRIQNDLFDLGADFAMPGEDFTPSDMKLRVVQAQVDRLEQEIDSMNEALVPLSSFILPSGSAATAALHVARTVTRRAERSAGAAAAEVQLNPCALAYLNRLSDHLFVMSRHVSADGDGEVKWVPGTKR